MEVLHYFPVLSPQKTEAQMQLRLREVRLLAQQDPISSCRIEIHPARNIIENMGMRLMSLRQTTVAACDSIVNPTLHIIEK